MRLSLLTRVQSESAWHEEYTFFHHLCKIDYVDRQSIQSYTY